jgi:hypothetical protein
MPLHFAFVVAAVVVACRAPRLRYPGPEEDCRLSRWQAAQREYACGREPVVRHELASLPPFRHHFRARVIVPYAHQYLATYRCSRPITCELALPSDAVAASADPEVQWCELDKSVSDYGHYLPPAPPLGASEGPRHLAQVREFVRAQCPIASDVEVTYVGLHGVGELSEYIPTSEAADGYQASIRFKFDRVGKAYEVMPATSMRGPFAEHRPCKSSWVDFATPAASPQRLFLSGATATDGAGQEPTIASLLAAAAPVLASFGEGRPPWLAPSRFAGEARLLPEGDFTLRVPVALEGSTLDGTSVRVSGSFWFSMSEVLFGTASARTTLALDGASYTLDGQLASLRQRPLDGTGTRRAEPIVLTVGVFDLSGQPRQIHAIASADVLLDGGRGAISIATVVDDIDDPGRGLSARPTIRLLPPTGLQVLDLTVDDVWWPAIDP